MQLFFDLISDLHLTDNEFDWNGRATSPICVVAGDISHDRVLLINALKNLSMYYQQVLYIDGNQEHTEFHWDYEDSLNDLKRKISKLKRVQYLHSDILIINGVAFVGVNGWWGFNFDPAIDTYQTKLWYQHNSPNQIDPDQIILNSVDDATYLVQSIKKLQTHSDVKKIVIVTHTVPIPQLIVHDIDYVESYKFNVMGNELLDAVRIVDTESKIHTWCFGHYHGDVDQIINNIRYVNNCRGRPHTKHWQHAYHPKRISVVL
jgi:uncharacterized membrane protein